LKTILINELISQENDIQKDLDVSKIPLNSKFYN